MRASHFLTIALVACNHAKPPSIARPKTPPHPSCSDEMALVPLESGNVCIDRYEAAIEGWPFSHPLEGHEGPAHRAIPAKGIKPQVNVNEREAEAACEASSKRLCTEEEWVSACRGPEHRAYPYGNEHVKGACNEGHLSPVSSADLKRGTLDSPKLAEAPNGIAPGGAFPQCVSPWGVYDMHGNVHEWVSNDSHPGDPRFGEFLGGFYADATLNGDGCSYKTVAHFKIYHDYSTGFRCCKDPTMSP